MRIPQHASKLRPLRGSLGGSTQAWFLPGRGGRETKANLGLEAWAFRTLERWLGCFLSLWVAGGGRSYYRWVTDAVATVFAKDLRKGSADASATVDVPTLQHVIGTKAVVQP